MNVLAKLSFMIFMYFVTPYLCNKIAAYKVQKMLLIARINIHVMHIHSECEIYI